MKHVIKNFRNGQTDLAVILLAAGMGDRITRKGTRSLYKIEDRRLIDYQVDVIKGKFPEADIISVLGFQADKVVKQRHSSCRIVENQLFKDTASGESLRLGFNNSCSDQILIIHGDLYFDQAIFDCMDFTHSFIVTSDMDHDEVGVVSSGGVATNFAYNLPIKWGQMVFLRDREIKILNDILNYTNCSKLWTFEILNKIIENKGILHCHHSESQIIEIDNPKDIERDK